MRLLAMLLLSAAALAVLPTAASAQATRTWVSGVGDDANPCSRTQPCKTFAGAISKTATAGEINVLDPGGYGGVTITKAITIVSESMEAGVLVSGTNGIVVNAPSTASVVLRGLDIEGLGTGLNGVRFLAGQSLTVADSTINGFTQAGVSVAPATDAQVVVRDVEITRSRDGDAATANAAGVRVAPSGTAKADVLLDNVDINDSETGVAVADRGHAWLTGSTIFGTLVGLSTTGSGVIDSSADNVFANNVKDVADGSTVNQEERRTTTVTVTEPAPAAPPPTTVTTTQTVPAPTVPAPTPAPVVLCKVPKLTGLTLAAARKKLTAANCATGKVTRKRTTKKKRGRVLSTDTKAGTKANKGEKVALVIGR